MFDLRPKQLKKILKTHKLLISLVAINFFYRLFIILNSKVTFYSDDAIYATLARFALEGNWSKFFHPTWPPLYPFATAIAYLIFGNWEFSARFISAIAGSIILIPVFILSKDILSKTVRILLIISVGAILPLVKLSSLPFSDVLAALLIICALTSVFTFFQQTSKLKPLLWAGIFLGLVTLTRAEGTMFFGLTLAFLLIFWTIQTILAAWKSKFSLKLFLPLFTFILVYLITVSPYAIAMRIKLGEWTLSQKFSNQVQQGHSFALKNGTTWIQEVDSISSPNYKSPYFRNGLSYVLDNFDYFRWWFWQKLAIWKMVFAANFPSYVIILFALGLLKLFQKRNFWSLNYLLWVLAWAIPVTIFSTPLADIRYLLWTSIIFTFLYYLSLDQLAKFFTKNSLIKIILPCLGFALSLTWPLFSVPSTLQPLQIATSITKDYYFPEIIEASSWINQNSDKPKIMMRHEGIEFLTRGQTIYLPQADYAQTIDYSRKHSVDYLIAWDQELGGDKYLSNLFQEDFTSSELEKVYQIRNKRTNLVIYTLK